MVDYLYPIVVQAKPREAETKDVNPEQNARSGLCLPDHQARRRHAGRHVRQAELRVLETSHRLTELLPRRHVLRGVVHAELRAAHAARRDVDATAVHCAHAPC